MSQTLFSADWPNQFSDPYAVLGLAVAADDRRVLKRYRTVAKLLHPDGYVGADVATTELATQLLTRVVNPAYQRLKQEKERTETLATLRFRVRRLREEPLLPQSLPACQLLQKAPQEVEIFYEQMVADLAESQFQPLGQFAAITQQLSELNLVYLYLKMGEPMLREKRTGIVAASQVKPAPTPPAETAKMVSTYARRHYQRATIYTQNANWSQAIAELRDAIRLEPDKAEYHSLIAKAYLMQNLMGMAKVHFRQALKFNPKDPLALEYVTRLKLVLDKPERVLSSSTSVKSTGNGLFGLFSRKP